MVSKGSAQVIQDFNNEGVGDREEYLRQREPKGK